MDEATYKYRMSGLMSDLRMGDSQTCGEGMSECPDHFGRIELARLHHRNLFVNYVWDVGTS
ncbi:uncharacterized protein LACBIDRAFT_314132 [Laccaria bicolor S238N-H82]|uniref:DNA-directed RNA polymerase n=1 Tax=Laccaria bicolor (strain S238N-H82 / ATCC MYA-4686) TaxID=486041 RepID=B0D1N7_LACBS|nr:uncharacterized protein LACBIDRAFT_314132 [Laccaria bicolor S238N-H82]EDR11675.1 predicted protein [Laccaria bicolor S238N-H82]|eukprot:XP_001877572.1 predicted protein [Laccaria bicolor S238N-H82]